MRTHLKTILKIFQVFSPPDVNSLLTPRTQHEAKIAFLVVKTSSLDRVNRKTFSGKINDSPSRRVRFEHFRTPKGINHTVMLRSCQMYENVVLV